MYNNTANYFQKMLYKLYEKNILLFELRANLRLFAQLTCFIICIHFYTTLLYNMSNIITRSWSL